MIGPHRLTPIIEGSDVGAPGGLPIRRHRKTNVVHRRLVTRGWPARGPVEAEAASA
jgi:hypothetical protein